MYTFAQLKSDIRSRVFPAGEAENLVAAHDKDFIDALTDLQSFVACLQQDNTDIFDQCATTYNCGLTVFPSPRGIIRRLSVIDRIDPVTFKENPDVDYDWCSEVQYHEVDFCHIKNYLGRSRACGCCLPIGWFFGLPFKHSRPFPTATDEGVTPGLPPLPLGFHYPQASTDRKWGRAGNGVWAKDRGFIYIAPWLQTTEAAVLVWDGIKRTWNPADPIDPDPLLSQAIEAYIRWKHAANWDKDTFSAQTAETDYVNARAMLIRQCREETRERECEQSVARASTIGLSTLYYNDEQSFTAKCPDGKTGSSVTRTILAGYVGSNVSVADANARAFAQAKSEAEAMLVCTDIPTIYWNDTPGQYTASCTQEDGAPAPDGDPVLITIGVGTVSSTVSVADANAQAQALAQSQAENQLQCTFWNRQQTYQKSCPDGSNQVTAIVPARSYHSNISQEMADKIASDAAVSQANQDFAGTVCPGGDSDPTPVVGNTERTIAPYVIICPGSHETVTINVTVPANMFYRATQAEANQAADAAGWFLATKTATFWCQQGSYGVKNVTYPGYV